MADCKTLVPKGKDPYKTIILLRIGETVVGRKCAAHPKCREYMDAVIESHKGQKIEMDFEEDPTGGLLWNFP